MLRLAKRFAVLARPGITVIDAAKTGAVILTILVSLFAYGFSVRLPFFSDDLVHFRWLSATDLVGIWTSARALGYYRPLSFTLWKLLWALQAGYHAPTMHALNIGVHALNSLLVLALVSGLERKRNLLLGLTAAILFSLFPFSYQAVPWVGSLSHPLATALILGALVLGWQRQRQLEQDGRASRALYAGSLALTLLAPFAHEAGALVAPLWVLLWLTREKPPSLAQVWRTTWPYLLCALPGLLIWLIVPKGIRTHSILNLESRWQNAVYFAQGLAYPLAPLATRLQGRIPGLSDMGAVLLVTVPVLVGWVGLLGKAGRWRLAALAIGWYAISMAPAWLMLSFSYVVDGPRLMYEGAVGAALLWASPVAISWARPHIRRAGIVASLALVVGIAWGSLQFIQARAALYKQMAVAVERLVALAEPLPSDEPLLCVNYPAWFAPARERYALGHEGVTLVPPYTRVQDLLWLHTGQEREVTSLVLPDVLQPWDYRYACAGTTETSWSIQEKLRQGGSVLLSSYGGPALQVEEAGRLEAALQARAENYQAAFDNCVALTDISWEQGGAMLRIALTWESWEPLPRDVTVFAHLVNEGGQLVAQADGYPLQGTSRLQLWLAGDCWRDVRVLALPQDLPPGNYTLKLGLYGVEDGQRLTALGMNGQPFAENALSVGPLPLSRPLSP